ncbi:MULTISPECIES: FAD-dependent monooxygenase [Pseudonocardia]|uniref:6-hydroxynicotinate 3-monooxygenase n=2 Tax=Pseudonocardia TaxID=1847 RepID=A0A1Y2N379_PSEAH|nr:MULTISPECIES: FAD-dependent monooxygenase [Pseudonocardia]OSY41557.1 6-hydroxynicotinate 3-monooxygenase precursor [Pseudonocardia autotrophica]TDN71512.1 2-polyprenyl-6-methoxyphenol hydroxylase-like FAD-dependent oxidoreductase [Pseudonocardia autotrophica]BBG02191.1 FAD-dependent oxidoreductase [Pseudonocardia autotrophica]GEC24205.1 FAD-dependent oxidoreductase [Pseudonocardia saturnea]
MPTPRVLISGASIAGPALALWLGRQGYDVTVVEKAPALRRGGQAVDFKGATHLSVLERMGVLEQVRAQRTVPTDTMFVDGRGRELATMPGEFTGGDLEIRRGDLARILYDATADDCTYIFGDSVTGLVQTPDGVQVTFERAAPATFDLVVGADGIHSAVRRLTFGPEENFVTHSGYYYALVDPAPGARTRPAAENRAAGRMYNEPGRMAAIDGPGDPAFFVFAAPPLNFDRFDQDQQRAVLAEAYDGAGWEVPGYLTDVLPTADVHLDSISRVGMDRYTRGRVALLGDAAYGNTLGGFGSGLAVVGACVLAGELAAAHGDPGIAFARYQELMHDYAKIARKAAPGPFLAPPTCTRIRLRNWIFKYRPLRSMMMKLGDDYATDIELPDYPRIGTTGYRADHNG